MCYYAKETNELSPPLTYWLHISNRYYREGNANALPEISLNPQEKFHSLEDGCFQANFS
jgi:hypothetical protein